MWVRTQLQAGISLGPTTKAAYRKCGTNWWAKNITFQGGTLFRDTELKTVSAMSLPNQYGAIILKDPGGKNLQQVIF